MCVISFIETNQAKVVSRKTLHYLHTHYLTLCNIHLLHKDKYIYIYIR